MVLNPPKKEPKKIKKLGETLEVSRGPWAKKETSHKLRKLVRSTRWVESGKKGVTFFEVLMKCGNMKDKKVKIFRH